MNITTTRKAVKNPGEYSTRELHEALDVLVNDERFSEKQVANGQYAIEAELTKRKAQGGRIRPIGTNVHDIADFDRSTKVVFACKEHPEFHYMSKQPSCSNWFPANKAAQDMEFKMEQDPCKHKYSEDVWFTVAEYLELDPVQYLEFH